MEVDVAVLADAAHVSPDGKLNITGVFRTLHSASAPIPWPPCVLVLELLLRGDEAARPHTLRISLVGPEEQTLREFPPITFGGNTGPAAEYPNSHSAVAVPLTFNLVNLVVPSFGLYRFDLRVDDDEVVTVEAEARPLT